MPRVRSEAGGAWDGGATTNDATQPDAGTSPELRGLPAVGQAFFPLDEELELLPGALTPSLQEDLVRLGAWMPFGRAAQVPDRPWSASLKPQVRAISPSRPLRPSGFSENCQPHRHDPPSSF